MPKYERTCNPTCPEKLREAVRQTQYGRTLYKCRRCGHPYFRDEVGGVRSEESGP